MRNYIIYGLIAITLVFGFVISRIPADINFLYFDDAFYYIDVATNSSLFNVTADGVSHTNGFHPLWMWSLMLLNFLGAQGTDLFVIGAWIYTYLAFISWFFVFKEIVKKDTWSLVCSLLLIFFPTAFLINISGMESPVVLTMFGLTLLSLFKFSETNDRRDGWVFGLVLGLLFLARTDMAIFAIALLIYYNLTYKENIKYAVYTFLSIVGLYLIYNLLTVGALLQTSGSVYPTVRWSEVMATPNILKGYTKKAIESVSYSASLVGMWFGSILIMFPLLLLSIKSAIQKQNKLIITLFIAAFVYFAIHNLVRFMYNIWYIQTFYIVIFLGVVYWFMVTTDRIRKVILATTALSVLFVLFGLFCFTDCQGYMKVENRIFKYWSNHERPVNQLTAATAFRKIGYNGKFGAFNSGEFGFFNQDVVNLDGLSNTDVMSAFKQNEGIKYLRDHNIHIIIDVNHYFYTFQKWLPLDSFVLVGDINLAPNDGSTTIAVALRGTEIARVVDSISQTLEQGQKGK